MKQLKSVLLVFCIVFMLSACGGSSPESIAEKYCKAAISADLEVAVKYATVDQAEELKEILSDDDTKQFILKTYKDAQVKLASSSVAEDGMSAKVVFDVKTAEGVDKDVVNIKVDLVKEGGDWKVDSFR